MRKKKVLFVSPLPPPAGGIASWMSQIQSQGLSAGGWEFNLVDTAMIRRVVGQGPSAKNFFFDAYREISILSRYFFSLFTCRPDVIHVASGLGTFGVFRQTIMVLMARLFKVPLVYHYHGDMKNILKRYHVKGPGIRKGVKRFFMGYALVLLQRISRSADYNLVLTPYSWRCISRWDKRKKVGFIPNPMLCKLLESREEAHLKRSSQFTVLYVGAIIKAKGCAEFYELAKRFSDLSFIMVGASPEKEFIENKPNNVTHLGMLSRDKVFDCLKQASLYLFLTHGEGFPVSLVEAMAAGLPAIATKVGAIPMMIDEGKGGCLVDVGNVDLVETLLKEYIAKPELLSKHGEYNRAKAKKQYDYDVVIPQYIELYERLIEEKRV